MNRVRAFRQTFLEFENLLPLLGDILPEFLTKLYSDCQIFAESEIKSLLNRFEEKFGTQLPR
jgi:hypothetical protein